MALPFFGKKAREAREARARATKEQLLIARKNVSARAKDLQGSRNAHKEVVAKNQAALELQGAEQIENSERVYLPSLSKEEYDAEKAAKAKRIPAQEALRNARVNKGIAKREALQARAEKLLDGSKRGQHIILESKPRKGRPSGNTYEGKFIDIDINKQRGLIVLEASNSKLVPLRIERIARRVK